MTIPVSFEIAKLLKEKGFDKPTDYAYCEKGGWNKYKGIKEPISYELRTNGNPFGSVNIGKNWNESPINTKAKIQCSAPTIAEVVMWLYKKHGIWISVTKDVDVKWSNDYFNYHILSPSGTTQSDIGGTIPNSPTEAYISAIEYVLNNLI